jgi:hypothetical protein
MINLDEVIRTEVMTARSILNSMMSIEERETLIRMAPGSVLTVRHDYGSFVLSFDEVQDYLAMRRLRGEV